MPEDLNQPSVPGEEKKKAAENEQAAAQARRVEQDGDLASNARESIEREPGEARRPNRTSSLLRRMTGSLYRITGGLEPSQPAGIPVTGPESEPEQEGYAEDPLAEDPLAEDPLSNDTLAEGALDDLRASLSLEPDSETPGPTNELRRMTDELDMSRLMSAAPPSPEKKPGGEDLPARREDPDGALLSRRMTGPFARTTGPLEPDPETPAPREETVSSKRVTGELQSPGEESRRSGEDLSPRQNEERAALEKETESPNLIRKITGSLRRVTGSLGTSPLKQAQRREEAQVAAQVAAQEAAQEAAQGEVDKPRRDTGQLRSMLSGILRGPEAEKKPPKPQDPDRPDYVSEIRQDLVGEEVQQALKPKGTGNIWTRLTGSLRWPTGQLGRPESAAPGAAQAAEPPQEPGQPDELQAEIEDVLLEDRLADTAPLKQPAWAEPEDIVIELPPIAEEEPFSFAEPAGPFAPLEESPLPGEPETGEAAGGPEPESALAEPRPGEIQPDWMAEMRQEAAEQETKGAGKDGEKAGSVTTSLRNILAGFFRPEEKQELPAAEPGVSDEVVTGRLGLDAGPEPGAGEAALGNVDFLEEEYPLPGAHDSTLEDDSAFLEQLQEETLTPGEEAESEEVSPFRPFNLEPSDEDLAGFTPYQPLGQQEDRDVYTISPEDERLLWGEAQEPAGAGAVELPEEPEKPEGQDAFVSTYLTGEDSMEPLEGAQPQKRRVTGSLKREVEKKPFEDIRTILLEDYQAAELRRSGQRPAARGNQSGDDALLLDQSGLLLEAAEPRKARPGVQEWLRTRTVLQKIILVEFILVVLALLVVIPLFILRFSNGNPFVASPMAANPLPDHLPYPTGLSLPGGWEFALEKSTIVNNKWNPTQAEWYEGSELRRVIALPWNRQTEAVVRSFQPGDAIQVTLNNQEKVEYTFERVERVPIDDTSIFNATSPSLVIILYEEEAQERWVVFSTR